MILLQENKGEDLSVRLHFLEGMELKLRAGNDAYKKQNNKWSGTFC